MSDLAHIPTHYHLVGDIGGTNARFALLVDSYAEPKEFPHQTASLLCLSSAHMINTAVSYIEPTAKTQKNSFLT